MATGVLRQINKVTMTRNGKLYGPFEHDISQAVTEAAYLVYQVSDSTTLQLVGGVSPQISELTTVTFLQIETDQDILIGLEGITVATNGAPLSANGMSSMIKCALTDIAIRNESGSVANITVLIEGQ